MEPKYISAIDIGTTKIACLIAKITEQATIELVGTGTAKSNGVWCGQVLNIEQTAKSIESAIADAQRQAGIRISEVSVGIAGKHIRCTQNRISMNKGNSDSIITENDVKKLINDTFNVEVNPGEEIIHVLPQTYIIDKTHEVNDPIGCTGRMLEGNFHLVICKTDSIKNINKCIERVSLKTENIILEPLASSDAVLNDDEKETGVVLIDIGGGTTDIAIYSNNIIIHTAVIPFGGNVITNDIKTVCGVLERHAEELKKQFGEAVYDLTDSSKIIAVPGPRGRIPKEIEQVLLAKIIQSRMEEIIEAINFEIEISGTANKIGAGIVITGGGSLLKNLQQLIAFKTGYDVRIGYPNEYIISNNIQEINNPMYATAVGLLLKGSEKAVKQQMEYNEEQAKLNKPKEKETTNITETLFDAQEQVKESAAKMPTLNLEDDFPVQTKQKQIKAVVQQKQPKVSKIHKYKQFILEMFDVEDQKFDDDEN